MSCQRKDSGSAVYIKIYRDTGIENVVFIKGNPSLNVKSETRIKVIKCLLYIELSAKLVSDGVIKFFITWMRNKLL